MRLLFIGDSLIEYFQWQERFPSHEVYNLGVAGETVEGLLYRLPEVVSNYKDPDFIFLMTGINNVAMEDLGFFNSYEGLLNVLKDSFPMAKIYIHSLLPVKIEFIDNALIRTVNEKLRSIAEGYGVHYMDLYRLFSDEQGEPKEGLLLDDGVHLSERGYEVWSKEIERHIQTDYHGFS